MPRTPGARKALPEPVAIDEDAELEQRRQVRRQARENAAAQALQGAVEAISKQFNVRVVAVPQIVDGLIVASIKVFAQ